MDIDYRLIENCRINRFPFKEGERVLVQWGKRWPDEYGTITKLFISHQWGQDVVHGVMVLLDGQTKPAAISPNLFKKIEQTVQPAQMGTPVQQTIDFT